MGSKVKKFDIIIAGAGPAGLGFALSLAKTGLQISVIDPTPEKILKNPPYDGRETALTHLSYSLLTDLGVLEKMDNDAISLIKKAHVINGDSPYALRFDHEEAGEETLGFMASNHNIRKASYAAAKTHKNITIMTERRINALKTSAETATVTLDNNTVLEASLIVGADGRFSATRRMMNIKTEMKDLGRTCIVGVMKHSEPHHDTAYECFHYDRTLAVLPLNNGLVSVVITLPSDEADAVVNMAADDFANDIENRFNSRVGQMKTQGALHPYPLISTYANSFIAQRFALLGDAAVGMHPVTAHGYNLGLRGADTLAQAIKLMQDTGGDIGSDIALRRYNRQHQLVCKPLYIGTNAIVDLFSNTHPAAKMVRKGLLRLGNVLKPANKLIMNQLTESKHV